jgi:uncharacterized protein (DUF433 family)
MAFKNLDTRELPNYSLPEAAHYLRVPVAVLKALFFQSGSKPAVFRLPDPKKRLLSFFNLVEAHVLLSVRRNNAIPSTKIRKAIRYVEKTMGLKRPLLHRKFREVIKVYFPRIEWDKKGLPKKFYPFVLQGAPEDQQPYSILIDPTISGGLPVLTGTGIAAHVVAERFLAGESVFDLAKDYRRNMVELDDLIRFETQLIV